MSDGGKGPGRGGPEGLGEGAEPVVMRRLLDEIPGDPLTPRAWALGMLRRTAPHRAPVGRKQRVRLALGQGGRRRALPVLRLAIAGVILVGFGAAASAALGRWPEIVQAYHRLLAPAASPAAVADARVRRSTSGKPARSESPGSAVEAALGGGPAPSPVIVPLVEVEPSAAPPGSTATSPVPEIQQVRDRPSLASRATLHGSNASSNASFNASFNASWRPRRASARVAAPAGKSATRSTIKTNPPVALAAASDASDDTRPVLEAMRALRVEGNPARARRLLASYLDRHPNGSLAEEALAMSIEAAVAHEDDDAALLARRYVRRYPAGHFSAVARRTLDGAAGTAN